MVPMLLVEAWFMTVLAFSFFAMLLLLLLAPLHGVKVGF
jgi:hypothetical protein